MNKIFPFLKKEFILRLGPKSHVYSLVDKTFYLLNKDAAEIIAECNGQKSVGQISKELTNLHNEDYKTNFNIINDYLNSQEFIGFSTTSQEIDMNNIGNWNIQTPVHVSIELTYNCNLFCKHCYNNSGSKNNFYRNKEEIFKVLDELKSSGVAIIELTGGEPLLHPDFEVIVKRCAELFNIVAVITNGYFITDEMLNNLNKYSKKLTFQIGLYSDDEKYMDWFCTKEGAFTGAKRAFKLLKERNFFVRANVILTPINILLLHKTVELAKKLGANSIALSNVIPMGRGDSPELLFTPNNFDLLVDEVESVESEFGDLIFKTPEYLLNEVRCGAGSRSFCITPNGDIKICIMAEEDLLSWGNVYNENLKDILSCNICSLFSDLDIPGAQICGECEHLTFCNNCIARGHHMYSKVKEKCIWGQKELMSIFKGDVESG